MTSAPLNSWGTKRGPRDAGILFYNNLAVQIGVCGGAYLSRLFAGTDPHQNVLVFALLPVVFVQVLLSEVALGSSKAEPLFTKAALPSLSTRRESRTTDRLP